jgi:DNA-binding response OmpR family regulator
VSRRSRILVVEDEKDICDLMSLHLKREGHDIAAVDNGEEALKILATDVFDIVILDWMLPGLSDAALARTPVFMVTARAHTSDIVVGLEMGADDYITKPFEIPVFLARVRALLRRGVIDETKEEDVFEVGDLRLDSKTYQVTCGKKDVQLTPSEFKLLVALMKNRGRVLTRERLIDLVQGEGVTVVDRTIDTHIFGLRKKLNKCSDIVETIRGVGYRVKTD